MKITLIYPGIAQIGFNSFGQGTPTTNLMSLGLGYIGASIKKYSDWEVDLIDLRKVKGWDEFNEELRKRSCDVVGIYVNTVNFDFASECAKRAKRQGKTVIAGGPHATWAPNELIDTGHIDHLITGEGEHSIIEVLDKLKSGKEVDNIIEGKRIESLDDIPFPDRDLFDLKERLEHSGGIYPFQPRYAGVIGSRGCNFNCAFCQPLERMIFGRKIRFRSVENMVKEVVHLKDRYKVRFVMFQDDLLTQWKEWVIDLCREMKGLNIEWGALARVDTIDEDLIKALRESNCKVLQFGFESGSPRILKLLRKGTNVDQALKAGRLCKENGILIFANYMMGIPTETREDLEATYELMRKIGPEILSANYFSPIPGSSLYDYCKKQGMINATSYEMFVRGAVDNKVKGVDYKLMGEYREKISVYSPPWYSERHYRGMALKRWSELIKGGDIIQAAREVIGNTPFLIRPVKACSKLIKGKK